MAAETQVPEVGVQEYKTALDKGEALCLDVREVPEFNYEHILGARNAPLSRLGSELSRLPKGKRVFVQCQAGVRSIKASRMLIEAGFGSVVSVKGGIDAWKQAGLPVQSGTGPIPIMRQVQIVAGVLVLAGCLVPGMKWLAILAGAGLVFAGVSGICLMAGLLLRMPWNRG